MEGLVLVSNFYLIVFVIAITMTGLFMIKNRKIDSMFVLFGVAIIANAMGRYMMATSTNIQMAIFAQKVLYVGSCYAPLILVLVLSRLCHKKMMKLLKYSLILYSTVVFVLVLGIDHNKLYYKSVKLVQANGYNYLEKEYGPLHMLYPAVIYVYIVLILYYLVYAIIKKNNISYKNVVITCCLASYICIAYILDKSIGAEIDFVSIGYLVAIIALGRFFDRVNMYDMSANIIYSIERMKEYGYISLDNKGRYIGANEYIKELFPEINLWQIDAKITKSDSYLYTEIIEFWQDLESKDAKTKTIQLGERYFEVCCREIYYRESKRIGHLLEFIDRTAENKYMDYVRSYNAMLEEEVEEKIEDIMSVKDKLVLGMADIVESRDQSTGGHIKRTSEVIKVFSDKLLEYKDDFGFTELFLKRVAKAAPMHDLGKIAVDDAILRKKGKFTEEDYNKMKKHSEEGAKIIEQILKDVEEDKLYEIAKNVAWYHHERWNGTGYPKGLREEEIPIEARIMALADVFDALVSERCYKEAYSYDKAFEIIESSLGEHFDPKLGKIFIECRPVLEKLYDGYKGK